MRVSSTGVSSMQAATMQQELAVEGVKSFNIFSPSKKKK